MIFINDMKIRRRYILTSIIAFFFLSTVFAQIKPNILFILTDDLGYNDLGCYGNEFYETPNIDLLCNEGMKFNQHYSAGAVCSPTRASIITGKYPARTSSTEVYPWGIDNVYKYEILTCQPDLPLSINQPFWPEEMKKLGYNTAMFGKWHLTGVQPKDVGYDKYLVNHLNTTEGQDIQNDEFQIHEIHKLTKDFIDSCVSIEEPFFAFVSHHSVHVPHASTPENREYFETKGALAEWANRPGEQTPVYAGMLKDLDSGIGELLAGLDELGVTDNTIIVFTSDNGGLGERNIPLRGGKSRQWEGGMRVPFIIKWANNIPSASQKEEFIVSTDYFPTIIKLIGESIDPGLAPDGEDFSATLLGGSRPERGGAIFHFPHYRGTDGSSWLHPWSVIRKGDYAYIHHWEADLAPNKATGIYAGHELYNLSDDEHQDNNLIEIDSTVASTLRAELVSWLENNNAQIPLKPVDQTQRPSVGAIRWDAWLGEANAVGAALNKSLGPNHYHWRLPFFSNVIDENTVDINGISQEVIDQEIEYAAYSKLDYFAYLLYDEDYLLSNGLKKYLSSSKKSMINFCVIMNTIDPATESLAYSVQRVLNYIQEPGYQKVLDDRALVYTFRLRDAPAFAKDLKDACAEKGWKEPYIVDLHWTDEMPSNSVYDAISRYWYSGADFGGSTAGAPYSKLMSSAQSNWKLRASNNAQQVPLVSLGADGRPRIENPVPWINDPENLYEKYFEPPTPEEITTHLGQAFSFVENNPLSCEARTVLMYAWNENDEGGWLMPTLQNDIDTNTVRIDVLRSFLQNFCTPISLTPDLTNLPELTGECSVTPAIPTATDNCSNIVNGTANVPFPITDQTITHITWSYNDGNGNTLSQVQNIKWSEIDVSTSIVDDSITANLSNAAYQWLDCNMENESITGETRQSFTPAENGNYAVEISFNGCVDTSRCRAFTILTSGADSDDKSNQVSIHPNPTKGIIEIEYSGAFDLYIINMNGEVLIKKFNLKNNSTIDLSEFKQGSYTLKIVSNNNSLATKFIKI